MQKKSLEPVAPRSLGYCVFSRLLLEYPPSARQRPKAWHTSNNRCSRCAYQHAGCPTEPSQTGPYLSSDRMSIPKWLPACPQCFPFPECRHPTTKSGGCQPGDADPSHRSLLPTQEQGPEATQVSDQQMAVPRSHAVISHRPAMSSPYPFRKVRLLPIGFSCIMRRCCTPFKGFGASESEPFGSQCLVRAAHLPKGTKR